MAEPTSTEQVLAWGKEHGNFFLGAVTLGITTAAGIISLTKHVEGLKKDLEHERERSDLLVKNQLFDILHHADYETAARLLRRSEASPAAPPSTN
jgi:hypothetical protein